MVTSLREGFRIIWPMAKETASRGQSDMRGSSVRMCLMGRELRKGKGGSLRGDLRMGCGNGAN